MVVFFNKCNNPRDVTEASVTEWSKPLAYKYILPPSFKSQAGSLSILLQRLFQGKTLLSFTFPKPTASMWVKYTGQGIKHTINHKYDKPCTRLLQDVY